MRSFTRIRTALAACLLAGALALTGCSVLGEESDGSSQSRQRDEAGADAGAGSEADVPYDVVSLLKPGKKYFGAAVDGAPISMKGVDTYTKMVGKQPNLIEYYAAWGDGFDATGVRNAWREGAMTLMSWEPFDTPIADIAAGKSDAYIKEYATAVRKLNLPVVISFADEFNGHWEKWGTKNVTPKDYVAAWRHLHETFIDVGASNVIWAWSPNIVNPVKSVKLKPYYPGDAYVDWVGLIGYWTIAEDNAFDSVFGATRDQVRTFTKKPMILLETAAMAGERRRADIRNLFAGVAADDDMLGFVWFNHKKRADWRLEASPLALKEFKRLAADDSFGFDVRKP
ncbi:MULTISPECIES: glycosyl hydrolase [unclassified Streptomyces]|uniref:glycoside hydrolase family 26 protein n=1 Tax=unclassified Streptomyces TaxID=2593676 RepID=UPI0023669D89|nr:MULTISPECIES: glycosyl hydrolase [unclassified Streptomyces]MDF3140759.1 glycosyl hydrolase [Streptomyces sp. T21Q-yed]WDF40578.1 glycosyl hydrolase [Streptomyces sp. T12]